MSVLFLTGDRSAGPAYLPIVAIELLAAVNRGDDVVTGDNAGVEQLVRELASLSDVEVNVVDTPMTDEGYSDWDARHLSVKNFAEDVRVIHSNALESRVGKSALDVFDDSVVEFVTPESLFV